MHYPHFMEVHLADDNCQTMMNIDNIVGFANTDNNGAGLIIKTVDKGGWYVAESYDELIALMIEAGTCFVKKDPRIDYHPITWAELTEMVGEPVWAENQQKWFLVAQYDEESKEITLRGATTELYKSTVVYTEQMLIAKPLYRMKVFS